MKKPKSILRRIKDNAPLHRFEMLRRIGKILVPKYRFKWPQIQWWDNPVFNNYLLKFNEIDLPNTDRRWMLYQLLRLVGNVPGDTAECGVYEGAGSYIICTLNQKSKSFRRTHYMFDSFEGLSRPLERDGRHWKAGDMSSTLETVTTNLSEFSNISIHKGWIPDRFPDVKNHEFCFVHIDVDLYQPTLESMKFFYPRINPGGFIVCDDYGFTSCPGATEACDKFLKDKNEKMIALSGGGGFLIKDLMTVEPL